MQNKDGGYIHFEEGGRGCFNNNKSYTTATDLFTASLSIDCFVILALY